MFYNNTVVILPCW